ncbi:MAG TPA: hypothetical protein VJ806_14335 [Luteimonas sp.]|nr:hypothetical protein [Luteimonas sp.]
MNAPSLLLTLFASLPLAGAAAPAQGPVCSSTASDPSCLASAPSPNSPARPISARPTHCANG